MEDRNDVLQPIVRVLLVANTAGDTARNVHEQLRSAGHAVTVASGTEWQSAVNDAAPEVVVFEPSPEIEADRQLCAELKVQLAEQGTPLLALLSWRGDSVADAGPRGQALRAAGADGFFDPAASAVEVEAQMELLARLSRLQRELTETRQQLQRQMQMDDLTQLLNRRFFFHTAYRECSRARRYKVPLSCLMVDVDYLSLFNRALGYACGDYLLRTVAHIIRETTRDVDVAARFSEHKFVILLPETGLDGAMILREKLQDRISASRFAWEEQDLPITISIGEAERHPEGIKRQPDPSEEDDLPEAERELISVREELAELLEDADVALAVARKGAHLPPMFAHLSPEPAGAAATV